MDILKGLYKEFGWFIWGMIGIAFIWFFTGGPQREVSHEGPFLKPPAPLDSGRGYGPYYFGTPTTPKQTLDLPESPEVVIKNAEEAIESFFEQSEQAKKIHATSLLAKTISLDGTAGARNTKPSEEYIRIVASPYLKGTVTISGLLLRGYANNSNVTIPKAAILPLTGVVASKSDISLPAGGRALISSGRSPIGTSFQINMCTGYLDQYQTYTPALLKDCPNPVDELLAYGPGNESSCVDFVEKLPRCRIYNGTFPANISGSCKAFVIEKLNYNSCALNHKNDAKFYSNEWRVFLDKTSELWSNKNEIIRLIDNTAKTIDAITY